MAETLSRPSTERLGTSEKGIREAFTRLDEIGEFVKANPSSSVLPELRAMLQEIVDEEEAAADILPEEESTPEIIPPAETEEKPKLTFEQARETADPLTDEFILDALSGDLQKPGGEKAWSVKGYLDNVPADASDKEYASTNSEVIQLRDELTDFVASELKIHAPPAYRSHLEDRKRNFIAKLEAGKQAFRDYVKGREARKDLSENRTPMAALGFYGLTIMTDGGKSVDLLESSVKDIYANLYVQREIAGNFIHWSSDEFVERKASGDRPKLTQRIYLNPRPQDSVGVFSDVIHAAQDAGLAVKGKIHDRTYDSNVMKAYDSVGENYNLRGDGIVLYATADEAEKLLAIAESIYSTHEPAFAGRGLSSVPFELQPGFGIGDEPTHAGESLTSHRAEVIGRVLQKVRESGESDPSRQIQLFRSLWQTEAALENIKVDNPAFNR
jgi:hypothetical protein